MATRGSERRVRQHMVAVRFSDEEWARIRVKATTAAAPVTNYVRDAALGREIAAGAQLVAELRRLGSLQKQLFVEGQRIGASEYARVLLAITDAIECIAAGREPRAK